MTTSRRLLALAFASVLVLSGTACSDDEKATPKKADYIKAADKLCTAGDDELEKAGEGLDEDSPKADLEAYYKKAADLSLKSIQDVRDLGYPEGDEKLLDENFKVYESAFQALKDDPAQFEDITDERQAALDEAGNVLYEYGLKECGSKASED